MATDLPPKLDKLRKRAALARAREIEARTEAEMLERKLLKRAAKLGIEVPVAAVGSTGRTDAVRPTGAQHRRQGIEAAISRLVRGGELQRVARGRYCVDREHT